MLPVVGGSSDHERQARCAGQERCARFRSIWFPPLARHGSPSTRIIMPSSRIGATSYQDRLNVFVRVAPINSVDLRWRYCATHNGTVKRHQRRPARAATPASARRELRRSIGRWRSMPRPSGFVVKGWNMCSATEGSSPFSVFTETSTLFGSASAEIPSVPCAQSHLYGFHAVHDQVQKHLLQLDAIAQTGRSPAVRCAARPRAAAIRRE